MLFLLKKIKHLLKFWTWLWRVIAEFPGNGCKRSGLDFWLSCIKRGIYKRKHDSGLSVDQGLCIKSGATVNLVCWQKVDILNTESKADCDMNSSDLDWTEMFINSFYAVKWSDKFNWLLGLHRIWLFQIRPEPKPDLAETRFLVTEQYASDKTNGVNNAVSRYRGSTVQCFLCCVTVCQLLIKSVE